MLFYVTFEVSESMFEVSGPKSGWYDHQSSIIIIINKINETVLFGSNKCCTCGCLGNNIDAPEDVWETKSMHLTIFEKEIDAPGDVWETKSMHQGCLGNGRRCRDQKSMQLPSYIASILFPKHPQVETTQNRSPPCWSQSPSTAPLWGKGWPCGVPCGPSKWHGFFKVGSGLFQGVFRFVSGLFRVGFRVGLRFLQVSSWFVLGSI